MGQRFIVFVFGVGMFLSTLDSTIINIALPYIAHRFHESVSTIVWAITLYALVLSTSIMVAGKVADRFGRKRVYAIGIVIFALGSLWAGLATGSTNLIIARGVQGLGAACLQATSIALALSAVTPEFRAKATGWIGLLIGLGPTLGPVLGGAIISVLSWRWVFFVNLPLCALTLWALRYIPLDEVLQSGKISWLTLVGAGSIILSVMLMINGTLVGLFALVFVVALVAIWIGETQTDAPLLPRACYRNPHFVVPILATGIFGGVMMVVYMLIPLFFHRIGQLPAWQIGFISVVPSIFFIGFSLLTGKKTATHPLPKLMLQGVVIMTATVAGLSLIHASWTWLPVVILTALYGMGAGIYQTPSIRHTLLHVDPNAHATGMAMIRMVQNMGIAIFPLIAGVLIRHHDLVTGIQLSWGVSAFALLLALFTIWFLLVRPAR